MNQIATRVVRDGELVAVFNEERFPFHHDSGQTLMTRSGDGGVTWSEPEVVLPWTRHHGQLGLRHLRARRRDLARQPDHHRLLQARHQAGGRFLEHRARSPTEWGDWTWAYKTQGWLGTFVVKSKRPRQDLERADPGQRAAAEAWRLPPRLLAAALRLAS